MTKKCLFDMSDLDFEKTYYSINLYKYRILDNLPQEFFGNFVLLVSERNCKQLKKKYPQYEQIIYRPLKRNTFFVSIFYNMAEKMHFKKFVDKTGCDTLFTASNIDYKLTPRLSIRKVTVIHDIKSIWEVNGLNRVRVRNYYRDIINNSDATIAISTFTKEHIVRSISGVKQEKLNVVYNSVVVSEKSVETDAVKGNDYLLYVNTLDEYKNIITLVKAYVRSKIHERYKLVVVAKPNNYWETVIMPLLQSNGLKDRVILLSGVEDSILRYLYEKASLFVSPSLNEGFGYTPIEAALCGCPVLCTKCEALQDTTRGLLNYYDDPQNDLELSWKIEQLLSHPIDKRKLEAISKVYRKEYSPKKQIAAVLELLELD